MLAIHLPLVLIICTCTDSLIGIKLGGGSDKASIYWNDLPIIRLVPTTSHLVLHLVAISVVRVARVSIMLVGF